MAVSQSANGLWYWLEVGDYAYTQNGRIHLAATGEVIGDWKQTLRLRPEGKKVDTTDTLLSSYRKALEKVLDDSECGVVPKSHLEDIEELLGAEQMRNKRDWHAKGELPPVGAEFEFSYNGSSWDECVMLFNDGITCLMAHRKYPANRWHYKCDDSEMRFRPIQTERERWVEKAYDIYAKQAPSHSETWTDILARIYDAGLAKMPEDK